MHSAKDVAAKRSVDKIWCEKLLRKKCPHMFIGRWRIGWEDTLGLMAMARSDTINELGEKYRRGTMKPSRDVAEYIISRIGQSHVAGDMLYQCSNLSDWLTAIIEREREEAAKARYNEEVDEFNAGYEAFENNRTLDDEPNDTKHDQWRVGWVWAKWNNEE